MYSNTVVQEHLKVLQEIGKDKVSSLLECIVDVVVRFGVIKTDAKGISN
jgi:hypothetical protein